MEKFKQLLFSENGIIAIFNNTAESTLTFEKK